MGTVPIGAGIAPENALDALLDELQTFSKPSIGLNEVRILNNNLNNQIKQCMKKPIP